MISVYNLKPKFQLILTPVLLFLRKRNISPNQLTFLAVILSMFIGLSIVYFPVKYSLLIVPIGLLLRMILNALDGMMARKFNLQSKKGQVLNELGDVVSDVFIYLPFIFVLENALLSIIVFVLLGLINEFIGVLGEVVGGERRYEGPMGKSDRALCISLVCFTLFFFPEVKSLIRYVFDVMSVLIVLSSTIRIYKMKL